MSTDVATGAARVARAKQLLAAGKVYPRGCSEFVCEVLEINYEEANDLMGPDPTYAGKDNQYTGLSAGDVAGWRNPAGHGHVAIYIGEPNLAFISVPDVDEKPKEMHHGFAQKIYKSQRY